MTTSKATKKTALDTAIKAAAWDETKDEVRGLSEEVRGLRSDLRIRRLTAIFIASITALVIVVAFVLYYLFITAPLAGDNEDRIQKLETRNGQLEQRVQQLEPQASRVTP